jgi:bifunctional non-homologous end joining protein LigD
VTDSLKDYRQKRRFNQTPEPSGERRKRAAAGASGFVVQKHDATRLHYDFRLEIDGTLKSWAVPKGPSLNPADKRLAMQTEDHPLDYAGFEGVIPDGQYGAGPVMVWDRGTFEPQGEFSASKQLERGELKFTLHGEKLRGSFVLVKIRSSRTGGKNERPWLLIKHKDAAADTNWDVDEHDGSVLSGRSLKEIEEQVQPFGTAEQGPNALEGAREAKLPARIEPMLASIAEKPFSNPEWLFEIKWDGVRALAWIRDGDLELRARSGRVITSSYPELAQLPSRFGASEAVLDGEIVVLDENGRSDFGRLQSRMHVGRPSASLVRQAPVAYHVFDVIFCDGYDLRRVPLIERKNFLKRRLEPGDSFRYADHVIEKGRELFDLARRRDLEGIVAKQLYSAYEAGVRSPLWLKIKITVEVDAVIGGWTAPRGSREHFGALLLGLYQGDTLRFIGGVGTGFTEASQADVFQRLQKLDTDHCPFDQAPDTKEKAAWVKPELVARVKYSNWTEEQRLRAGVFVALRPDLNSLDCRFEEQVPTTRRSEPATARASTGAHSSSKTRKSRTPESGGDGSGETRVSSNLISMPPLASRLLSGEEAVSHELFHGRAENVNVEVEGRVLRLSNLNKVYFPESGYTKRDVLAYYYRVSDYILPFLEGRPLVLRRYPNGISGESFFQKEAGEAAPWWMKTIEVASEAKRGKIRYFVADDRASLLYLTNLGCIDHNPWSSGVDDLDHPDYFFFDLDPSEGTEFETVLTIARSIYNKIETLGMAAFMKTSGATGFHIYLPVERHYTYEQVRTFADIIGRIVAAEHPKHVTQERTVEKRMPGTVLIDAYQNASGRPLASAYSVRAFPHAPVSTPVGPDELKKNLRPERLNMRTVIDRLQEKGDLWREFWNRRQRLEDSIEKLRGMHTANRR